MTALPFADGQFSAAFNSHVLEHMPDLDHLAMAWSEMHRVADHVFTCVPGKGSVLAWMIPDHHLWVKEEGEGWLWAEEKRGPGRAHVYKDGMIYPV